MKAIASIMLLDDFPRESMANLLGTGGAEWEEIERWLEKVPRPLLLCLAFREQETELR